MDSPVDTPEDLRTEFIAAMAQIASPVTIVATDGPAGRLGLTVSAVTSVSADPPLLLACIHRKEDKSPKYEATESLASAIVRNGSFSVNVLTTTGQFLAESFSGRPREGLAYDFTLHSWSKGPLGQPLLDNATASFECHVDQTIEAGSHRIFIGRVMCVKRGQDHPLVYYRRSFTRLAD